MISQAWQQCSDEVTNENNYLKCIYGQIEKSAISTVFDVLNLKINMKFAFGCSKVVKITTEIQILAIFCQKSAEAKEPGTRETVT